MTNECNNHLTIEEGQEGHDWGYWVTGKGHGFPPWCLQWNCLEVRIPSRVTLGAEGVLPRG